MQFERKPMQHHDTAQTIMDVATKAQYGGSAVAAIFSFLNQYAAGIGVCIAVLGFCVNWYYRHKQDKREEASIRDRP
jgi:uncharacterized membrane protein